MDDEQLYYKEKYFKYKLKYLALKEQLGGRVKVENTDIIGNSLAKGLLYIKNQTTKKTGGFDKKKFISYLEADLLNNPSASYDKQALYDIIKHNSQYFDMNSTAVRNIKLGTLVHDCT